MKNPIRWLAASMTLSFLFANSSCKDDGTMPPSPIPERVTLTLIDVAVKEVYLHISVTNPAGNETLSLKRNGAVVLAFAAVSDTTIADTTLTQSTAYQYTATVQTNMPTGTSNIISAQTLAPTSHSFTCETVLLGDGNGSALYDVALINDTLAYAVGEIYLSGDPLPYNLAKWDGQQWQLQRINYVFRGSLVTVPIHGIFAFSSSDIWLASGDAVHGDGSNWTGYDIRTIVGNQGLSFYRCWGLNSNNMYFVGPLGSIARYNGSRWTQLGSGTTTSILDAWGVVNPVSGAPEVFCTAGNKILRVLNGTQIDSVPWVGNRTLDGIWTHEGSPVFTSGDGVFENSKGECSEVNIGASIYTNGIRGSALNNIVAVGDFGLIAHFNGVSWHPFFENPGGDYYNVSVKGNLIIAVGEMNARGLIIIGRRN